MLQVHKTWLEVIDVPPSSAEKDWELQVRSTESRDAVRRFVHTICHCTLSGALLLR